MIWVSERHEHFIPNHRHCEKWRPMCTNTQSSIKGKATKGVGEGDI